MTDFNVKKNIRVWLGGSFDPVHLGHLAIVSHMAEVLADYLNAHPIEHFNIYISLLPTAHNPLKPYPINNHHRLAMLALVLKDLEKSNLHNLCAAIKFQIDNTEIYQTDKVFTFNTFLHFRKIYPDDSLIFVLGMDSILAFEKWYRAYELPTLCHLWVMPRVSEMVGNNRVNLAKNATILSEQLSPYLTENLQDLILTNLGRIYLDKYRVLTISSSQIRAILADKTILPENKKQLLQSYLTPSVLEYILAHDLYKYENSLS